MQKAKKIIQSGAFFSLATASWEEVFWFICTYDVSHEEERWQLNSEVKRYKSSGML